MPCCIARSYEKEYGGEGNSFTVDMFMQRLARSHTRVALVIDATGESPRTYFHNVADWEGWDVQLVKLGPHGSGMIYLHVLAR